MKKQKKVLFWKYILEVLYVARLEALLQAPHPPHLLAHVPSDAPPPEEGDVDGAAAAEGEAKK